MTIARDYFTNLRGLGVLQLVERQQRAQELLTQAEEHQRDVERRLIASAAERVATGEAREYDIAERDQRLAAQRVADCRAVLGQMQAAAEAARVVAFGDEQVRALRAGAPDRRRKLIADLERAQFVLGQRAGEFEDCGSAWMLIEKPKPHPPERRLTILGERLKAARDGAQAEVDRIRRELRELDDLQAA
jgi:hypothetical protein